MNKLSANLQGVGFLVLAILIFSLQDIAVSDLLSAEADISEPLLHRATPSSAKGLIVILPHGSIILRWTSVMQA